MSDVEWILHEQAMRKAQRLMIAVARFLLSGPTPEAEVVAGEALCKEAADFALAWNEAHP